MAMSGINFIFHATTITKRKKQIYKISWKLKKMQFWPNQELDASSWKIQSGCNKNSDEEATLTFTLHGHKKNSKIQIQIIFFI